MLVIKNWDKILGDTFCDGRFLCSNHNETPTTISFWFKDLQDKIDIGGVWIDIIREKHWDNSPMHGGWYYHLHYPNIVSKHQVSADWFSDIDNARASFEQALNEQ